MPATIDLAKAHLSRVHGDITVIFSWVNDERAMVLVPHLRKGAPWFIVMESAAHTWDDTDARNIPTVIAKATRACEVLGIEPSPWNCRRIAGLVIDGLPDLIRMPSSPPKEYHRANFGHMELRADGDLIAAEDIRMEKEGATYG
jgi:hypothetical protein